jgi:hypothetical protein
MNSILKNGKSFKLTYDIKYPDRKDSFIILNLKMKSTGPTFCFTAVEVTEHDSSEGKHEQNEKKVLSVVVTFPFIRFLVWRREQHNDRLLHGERTLVDCCLASSAPNF